MSTAVVIIEESAAVVAEMVEEIVDQVAQLTVVNAVPFVVPSHIDQSMAVQLPNVATPHSNNIQIGSFVLCLSKTGPAHPIFCVESDRTLRVFERFTSDVSNRKRYRRTIKKRTWSAMNNRDYLPLDVTFRKQEQNGMTTLVHIVYPSLRLIMERQWQKAEFLIQRRRKYASASLDKTDERPAKMRRLAKTPEIRVLLDEVLLCLIKRHLANGRYFADIFLQTVNRRFAVLPIGRNVATSLQLRGNRTGIALSFRYKVTLERHRARVETWTDGNLREHLLNVFSSIQNFKEISYQSSVRHNYEMKLPHRCSIDVNAALIERGPIKVRRLLLYPSWNPNPMLNGSDVLIDRDALRSITFGRVDFSNELSATTANRYLLMASTCANVRSVSLNAISCAPANSARLNSLTDFLQRLPNLRRLKLGAFYMSSESVDNFLATLAACTALKHLHLVHSDWLELDFVLQPSAIDLIDHLRGVIVADDILFTDWYSTAFNAAIFKKLKLLSGALPSDACIAIDFASRYRICMDRGAVLRSLLKFSRQLHRAVKAVDLYASKYRVVKAIESLPADAFVGRKMLVDNSRGCLSLSDDQATIVFTGLKY